jgi:hypothetical protein
MLVMSRPSPSPFFDAIGRVAFETARLELAVHHLLATLRQTFVNESDVAGATLTGLADYCKRALKARDDVPEDSVLEIRDVITRVRAVARRRAGAIHSHWAVGLTPDGTPSIFAGKPSRGGLVQEDIASVDDIYAIAADMYVLYADVFNANIQLVFRLRGDAVPRFQHKSAELVNPHGTTSDGRSIAPTDATEKQLEHYWAPDVEVLGPNEASSST